MSIITVPDPASRHAATMSDGAVITLRRHGNLSAPRVILSNENGCAIEGDNPYWRLLLADFEVVGSLPGWLASRRQILIGSPPRSVR